MLKCKNVSIKYENYSVLENISFDLKDGECLYIVGENGSGKSSLLKAMLGLIPVAGGEIVFDRKPDIGYLSQNAAVKNDFPASAFEVVLSGQIKNSRFFYSREQKNKALEKMREMGVYEVRNKCFRSLSGGMRQRTLLARALCSAPSFLVLDEPLTGLDFTAAAELYKLLSQLKKGDMTIIIVSHDINGALKYADKILYLGLSSNFFGTPDEFIKSGKLSSFGGGAK